MIYIDGVWLMLGRIVNSNNVSVEPWGRVRRRMSIAVSDGRVAVVFLHSVVVVGVVVVVVVVVDFALLLSFSLLFVVVVLVFMAVYGYIIIVSTQICDPSYFKRLHS